MNVCDIVSFSHSVSDLWTEWLRFWYGFWHREGLCWFSSALRGRRHGKTQRNNLKALEEGVEELHLAGSAASGAWDALAEFFSPRKTQEQPNAEAPGEGWFYGCFWRRCLGRDVFFAGGCCFSFFFGGGGDLFADCLECVLRLYRIAAICKQLCGVARGSFSKTAVTWLCWIPKNWQDRFIKVMFQIFKAVQTKKRQQNVYQTWFFPDSLMFPKIVRTHEE